MFGFKKKKKPVGQLAAELAKWRQGPHDIGHGNAVVANAEIASAEDAREVITCLTHLATNVSAHQDDVHDVISLIQAISSQAAAEVFIADGTDVLIDITRQLGDGYPDGNNALFALKQLAYLPSQRGVTYLAEVLTGGRWHDEFLWSIVLNMLAQHEQAAAHLIAGLNGHLPTGFAGVAYLDMCNVCCRESGLTPHPFDTPAGHDVLKQHLRGPESSYAVSTCAALPFLTGPDQIELFSMAAQHTNTDVRIESAWAQAATGDERGTDVLSQLATDPLTARQAIAYLTELEEEAAIPTCAKDPDFQALAEMAGWLAHPNEYGRAPQAIEIMDHRAMVWPPVDDFVPVWLVRYTYTDDGKTEVGVGMVGTTTFALFGETDIADLTAEDIYGLHCCWEAEMQELPVMHGQQRSAALGRQILRDANPGMGF